MIENLTGMFLTLDKKIVIGIIVVLAIFIVLSIIKKAIKLAIVIGVFVVIILFGNYMVDKVKNEVGIDINGSVITIDNDEYGKMKLDMSDINQVFLSEDIDESHAAIFLLTEDGEESYIVDKNQYAIVKAIFKIKGFKITEGEVKE